MSNPTWKYAARLDPDQSTTNQLVKMFEFWNHGPSNISQFRTISNSPAASANTSGSPTSPSEMKSSYRPSIPSQYVIFSCVDGVRYLVSHSVARLCDSLASILDELDIGMDPSFLSSSLNNNSSSGNSPNNNTNNENETTPPNSSRENLNNKKTESIGEEGSHTETLLEECAVLEIAISSQALEAVLVYLASSLEKGSTTMLPYPLPGPLNTLITSWEQQYLDDFAPAVPPTSTNATTTNKSAMTPSSSSAATASASSGVNQQTGDVPSAVVKVSPAQTPAEQKQQQFSNNTNETTTTPAGGRNSPFAPVSAQQSTSTTTTTTTQNTNNCPPLLSVLRAADYLGINTLRDLACASLASKLLSTKDEQVLAQVLGVAGGAKLPKENELEDVYSRFPFLSPSKSSQMISAPSSTAPVS